MVKSQLRSRRRDLVANRGRAAMAFISSRCSSGLVSGTPDRVSPVPRCPLVVERESTACRLSTDTESSLILKPRDPNSEYLATSLSWFTCEQSVPTSLAVGGCTASAGLSPRTHLCRLCPALKRPLGYPQVLPLLLRQRVWWRVDAARLRAWAGVRCRLAGGFSRGPRGMRRDSSPLALQVP